MKDLFHIELRLFFSLQIENASITDAEVNEKVGSFFRRYTCVQKTFHADNIQAARERNQSSFSMGFAAHVRWSGYRQSTVTIVGLREDVAATLARIETAAMLPYSQRQPPSKSTQKEKEYFVYEKQSDEFRDVLKFVLTSREETQKLRCAVKGIARYEAFPNIQTPAGLKLYPCSQAVSATVDVAFDFQCSCPLYDP